MTANIVDECLLEREIVLPDGIKFGFVRESLERIGIAKMDDKHLFQTCHILDRGNKLYIVHYKEMLKLEGRDVEMTPKDVGRRNYVACLLARWGMVENVNPVDPEKEYISSNIHIIRKSEKDEWKIVPKYTFR